MTFKLRSIKSLATKCPGCGEDVAAKLQVNDYTDDIENVMVLGTCKRCRTAFSLPLNRRIWTTLSKQMADMFKKL
ncbi:MAG: hypothetical protein JO053_14470 [Acidobacteria bacterium]|nr:hypothetical protein [Acidobacteriota bacterium]